ncbi:MAG: DUF429 domain-containing protein [Archaeoglobaceae archaeon]|nr:DUF429 domain-containing protein [Archaeoglobaceae archaeon]MDW7989237.1 DUF429 domain-containing protein [Archaeoglobaceae archaeon]
MIYGGIDVGKRSCKIALIDKKVVYIGEYDKSVFFKVYAVGIDAPLTLPENGMLRECEKDLLKLGIKLFPSGAPFFKEIALIGMKIAEELRDLGLKVYEVYPFASRFVMNIAPKAKKRTKRGLEEIKIALSNYIEIPELSHDEIDAVISALTVREYVEGRGSSVVGEGEIILPRTFFSFGR